MEFIKLYKLIKPCKGERIAVVYDSMLKNTILIDLESLQVIMSDSEVEYEINKRIVDECYGDVLILGFGLGYILNPLMNKDSVKSITVLEIENEILDLVASQMKFNDKVKIILTDALSYVPTQNYDIIFSDLHLYNSQNDDMKKNGKTLNIHDESKKHLLPFVKDNGKFIFFHEMIG